MSNTPHRLLGSAASTVDRAFVAAMQLRNRRIRARSEALSHPERLASLARVREVYGSPELIARPELFFPPPPPAHPNERYIRDLKWGSVCDELSWQSAFLPFDGVVGKTYVANIANRTAHARLYHAVSERPLGKSPGRPAIVIVHGYMTGQWAFEERTWPIRWLNEQGLDVALVVLPFHGVRARAGGGAPPFPAGNPAVTNEGFRQAVADVRSIMGILRDRGAPSVGITGMSLGGYVAALLATLSPDLAFSVPMIPLASIADTARDQGRLGTGDTARLQHAALEAANWVTSPLARPSVLSKEQMLIVAAENDCITPIAHAERLAAHFDAPLLRLPGGHVLQVWRGRAFRAVREMLVRLEII